MTQLFASAQEVVDTLRPREPVHLVRPRVITTRTQAMLKAFPGDVLYAVKCNDHDLVIDALYQGGVRHFDTASIAEVRQISTRYPGATCHFMHPVKSREAIAEAYYKFGVRSFVFDHQDELDKILEVTRNARDLTLVCRLDMPRGQAKMCLAGKFGTSIDEAVTLLQQVVATGCKSGLTFHVGSQCVDPSAFSYAIEQCGEVIRLSGVAIDVLDVGGGFPGEYTGEEPAFVAFVQAVTEACAAINLPKTCRLQCEPGRALVADGVSVIARVELRRDAALFLNDGTYGGLAELKYLGNCFPQRVLRPSGETAATGKRIGFDFYGPTCDSVDSMPGPHYLPSDVREGDWVEIGLIGAYSNSLRTGFNGFDGHGWVTVIDEDVMAPAIVYSLPAMRSAA
ncbi:type III PLP-dependent enzyme [Insolitispirillum peregrinum]|uniref:type III PLP-dependent enzyme n=1 Tax=Insolitispirillum peregrinum TaxID=80876 RepID=UPI00361FF961